MFFDGNEFSLGGFNDKYYAFHAHVPTYYGVQYNHSGRLYLRINKKTEYRVEGPCAFISHPGAFFEYGSIGNQAREHDFICFYGPRVQQYIDTGFLPINEKNALIKINHPEKFKQSIRYLVKTIYAPDHNHDRAVLMLEDLLLQLHEQSTGDTALPPHQAAYFSELIERIGRNFRRSWDFDKEAARLNITPVHFRRLFKRLYGMPPQQFLIKQRLNAAGDLLVNTNKTVENIASETGFENSFYFSRLFKKKLAISPLEYRKEFAGRK